MPASSAMSSVSPDLPLAMTRLPLLTASECAAVRAQVDALRPNSMSPGRCALPCRYSFRARGEGSILAGRLATLQRSEHATLRVACLWSALRNRGLSHRRIDPAFGPPAAPDCLGTGGCSQATAVLRRRVTRSRGLGFIKSIGSSCGQPPARYLPGACQSLYFFDRIPVSTTLAA